MKRNIIRQVYLYAVSIVSLFIIVFSCGQAVNIGLKSWVFTKADRAYGSCDYNGVYGDAYGMKPASVTGVEAVKLSDEERAKMKAACEKNMDEQRAAEKQRDLVSSLSMLVVSLPVFIYHFRLVQKERDEPLVKIPDLG